MVSTVFLFHLKNRYPNDEIHVLSPPALASLFSSHPAVASVVKLPFPYRWNIAEAIRLIAKESYDEVFVLPRSARTTLEAWLARIPVRVGFGGALRRFFLTKSVAYNPALSYPRRYLSLIDDHASARLKRPYFPMAEPSGEELRWVGLDASEALKGPLLGIAPVSIASSRTWEARRFGEIARRFKKETGGSVVLIGARRDENSLRAIADAVKSPVLVQAGRFSLPSLGWLINRLDVFLGNDSGLMHVASAFDVPAVVLFGASDPRVAVPETGSVKALQHPEVSCVPCLRNTCVRFGPYNRECLTKITADEVWSELSSRLK